MKTRVLVVVLLLSFGGCDRRGLPDPAPLSDAQTSPDAGPTYIEQVIQACVMATACGQLPREHMLPGVNGCLRALEVEVIPWAELVLGWGETLVDSEVTARWLSCAAKHPGDCGGFHSCYGGTWVTLGICRPEAECQGSRIVHPDDPGLYVDCASLGGTCTVKPKYQMACCARKPCSSSTTACTSGTRGTLCFDRVSVELDCGPAICTTAGCAGTGEICAPEKQPMTCLDPTVVRYCAGGRELTYDCSNNPFAGVCDKYGQWPCVAAGSECYPGTKSTCQDRGAFEICVDGYKVTVDCKARGFSGCEEVDGWPRCAD